MGLTSTETTTVYQGRGMGGRGGGGGGNLRITCPKHCYRRAKAGKTATARRMDIKVVLGGAAGAKQPVYRETCSFNLTFSADCEFSIENHPAGNNKTKIDISTGPLSMRPAQQAGSWRGPCGGSCRPVV